jgi:hypothetical protein
LYMRLHYVYVQNATLVTARPVLSFPAAMLT